MPGDIPSVLGFNSHQNDPSFIISAIGKVSTKHSKMIKQTYNESRIHQSPSPSNVQYQRIHISNIPVTTVDPRSMIPSQPSPQNADVRGSQGLPNQSTSRPKLNAIRDNKNKSVSRSPKDQKKSNNIKDFHAKQQMQYQKYLKKNIESSAGQLMKGLTGNKSKEHQQSQSTLLYHQTEEMRSVDLGSKPETKNFRDANAQIARSAESSFIDD